MKTKLFFAAVVNITVLAFLVLPIANEETKNCSGDAKLVSMPSQTTLKLEDTTQLVIQLS